MDVESSKMYIPILSKLIRETIAEPERSALKAAHNRLMQDVYNDEAAKRTPRMWPQCPKCGKSYISEDTDYEYIKTVSPACYCGSEPVWGRRPKGEWNTCIQRRSKS